MTVSLGADVLVVALGVPLQEKWIYKNKGRLKPVIFIGVGALLDTLSGRIARAPRYVRRFSFEWLWRLMMEPQRLMTRYLIDDLGFIVRVTSARLWTIFWSKFVRLIYMKK